MARFREGLARRSRSCPSCGGVGFSNPSQGVIDLIGFVHEQVCGSTFFGKVEVILRRIRGGKFVFCAEHDSFATYPSCFHLFCKREASWSRLDNVQGARTLRINRGSDSSVR